MYTYGGVLQVRIGGWMGGEIKSQWKYNRDQGTSPRQGFHTSITYISSGSLTPNNAFYQKSNLLAKKNIRLAVYTREQAPTRRTIPYITTDQFMISILIKHINPIFHSPGHKWPGFFECLQLKNLLSENILKIWYSWRSVFSIFFSSGLSPYNDAFLTYSAKSPKNLKIQVIWDLGRGNPATLGRKNRTCHVTPTPPSSHVTWATRFNVTWGSDMMWKKRAMATRVK